MYLCYIDESGTPDIPGNTSHFVLAGLAVPISAWKACDQEIELIKHKFGLAGEEIHVAWLLRPYLEQSRIPNFPALNYQQRRSQVESLRNAELLRLQRGKNSRRYRQARKNFRETQRYIHLTSSERRDLVRELAERVAGWGFARLFAECIDKIHFDPARAGKTTDEQAFEQIVSRFEQYLQIVGKNSPVRTYGLLIHDSNETVAKKHTALMKRFHESGTLWTAISNIIETPLFVDSQLTGMVQIADLCAYALRRYLENEESDLFDLIFQRADRKDGVVVGVRHFTKRVCPCKICTTHRKT